MRYLPLLLIATLAAVVAVAQDRTVTLRAADVEPTSAQVQFLADGGCTFATSAKMSTPGAEWSRWSDAFPFNGARCSTLRTAAGAAARRAFKVGDGGLP